MQKVGGDLRLSSVDLVGHLNCRYLTELDLRVANGRLEKPKIWDPMLEILAERGAAHEKGFVDHLKEDGLSITVIGGIGSDAQSISATETAMILGAEVIVQGTLQAGRWNGRADILRRVEAPGSAMYSDLEEFTELGFGPGLRFVATIDDAGSMLTAKNARDASAQWRRARRR